MLLIGAVLACRDASAPDPELATAAAALARWREGRDALDAGRWQDARAAFAAARALRPDPVLAAWEARALADGGDAAGAIARYREALAGDPTLASARWALALLLARTGATADAAAELRRALGDGAGDAVDVRLDAEWAPFLADPAFAFVPAAAVALRATAPLPDTTYWGSELTVPLVVEGRTGPTVTVSAAASGPVTLVSVTETVGPAGRAVELVWRVVGAGPITLGPFAATTVGTTVEAPALATVAAAPPGKEVPPPGPAWAVVTGDALPDAIARRDGVVWVPLGPTDRVVTDPPRPQLRVVRREGDAARAWIGLADTPPGTVLRVGRGREQRDEVAP